ncbi:FtsX-like permease family protein [Micromonospora sp. DT47]|uniref:FtsX-like permease family protein n=1 Tax=Micromonospora sp. DT47 TaxID=3393431 RepID=UPI003CE9A586
MRPRPEPQPPEQHPPAPQRSESPAPEPHGSEREVPERQAPGRQRSERARSERQGSVGPGRGGRLAAALGSWRAALRIARREARRARGRTALVLAMITLPVLALTFVAVSYDMSTLTRAERLDQRLGDADAELHWVAQNPVVQDPWGDTVVPRRDELVGRTRQVTPAELTALLPPGSRVSAVRRWLPVDLRVGDRFESFDGRVLDLTEPVPRTLARLRAGRPPTGPAEIGLSGHALDRLGARVGGTVTTAGGSRTYTVVGVVEFPDDLRDVVALHPDAAPPTSTESDQSWLVDLPGPLDAALAARLNAHGILVVGRTPVPGAADLGVDAGRTPLPDAEETSTAVLVGGLGLLEVVLLVGPAFAVGVRRRRRDLALVAVAGGDAVHLRRIVLADGLVLGLGGAALGLLLGIATAFAGRPLVEQYVLGARVGGYRVFPTALVAIAGVAVLAGVLAALAPAWTAARQDVVAGLGGRRTVPPHRRRWLVAGVALTVLGAATAAAGAQRTVAVVVLTGLVLGELGLVFVTPTLIGLLARAGRVLPLAPRIAVRDASRNRSSAAPAISAVMAAVAGSVAVGVYVASDDARNRAQWQPDLPPGHVLLRADPSRVDALPPVSVIAERVHAELSAESIVRVDDPVCAAPRRDDDFCTVAPVLPPERACPYQAMAFQSAATRRRALADPRCLRSTHDPDGLYPTTVVDDGSALPGLTGAPPEEVASAAAVLKAGGAVVTDPRYVVDGRITLSAERSNGQSAPDPPTVVTVPGRPLRGGLMVDRLVLSPAAAARLGLIGEQMGYVVDTTAAPGAARQARLAAALRPLAPLVVEVTPDAPESGRNPLLLLLAIGSGLITVGAAGVATGLAAAEGRRDLSTLAAVGASPRLRRVLSLCQAGVIAVLGSLLGIVAGLGSAVIILTSVNRQYARTWPVEPPYPVVVPWPTLGVLVVVPLVAMLGAGLFTRSRLAAERRLD